MISGPSVTHERRPCVAAGQERLKTDYAGVTQIRDLTRGPTYGSGYYDGAKQDVRPYCLLSGLNMLQPTTYAHDRFEEIPI